MPLTHTSDGITLAWNERGRGADVILVNYWSSHPDVFAPLTQELEADHRVITYDDRGSGDSDRVGPYDIETSTADLEAVADAAGAQRAVAIGMTDGANRAVRVAQRRPELIDRVVTVGGAPVTRAAFTAENSDALIASDAVVGVFLTQLRTFFRGALRSMIEAGNPQMTQAETAARVANLVAYREEESVSGRVEAWQEDTDAAAIGGDLGDRLDVLIGDAVAGGWFPPADQAEAIFREYFPDARYTRLTDGIVSAPGEVAAVIRRSRAADLQSSP